MAIFLFCLRDIRHLEPALKIEGRVFAFDRGVPVFARRRMEFKFLPDGRKNETVNKRLSGFEFDGE